MQHQTMKEVFYGGRVHHTKKELGLPTSLSPLEIGLPLTYGLEMSSFPPELSRSESLTTDPRDDRFANHALLTALPLLLRGHQPSELLSTLTEHFVYSAHNPETTIANAGLPTSDLDRHETRTRDIAHIIFEDRTIPFKVPPHEFIATLLNHDKSAETYLAFKEHVMHGSSIGSLVGLMALGSHYALSHAEFSTHDAVMYTGIAFGIASGLLDYARISRRIPRLRDQAHGRLQQILESPDSNVALSRLNTFVPLLVRSELPELTPTNYEMQEKRIRRLTSTLLTGKNHLSTPRMRELTGLKFSEKIPSFELNRGPAQWIVTGSTENGQELLPLSEIQTRAAILDSIRLLQRAGSPMGAELSTSIFPSNLSALKELTKEAFDSANFLRKSKQPILSLFALVPGASRYLPEQAAVGKSELARNYRSKFIPNAMKYADTPESPDRMQYGGTGIAEFAGLSYFRNLSNHFSADFNAPFLTNALREGAEHATKLPNSTFEGINRLDPLNEAVWTLTMASKGKYVKNAVSVVNELVSNLDKRPEYFTALLHTLSSCTHTVAVGQALEANGYERETMKKATQSLTEVSDHIVSTLSYYFLINKSRDLISENRLYHQNVNEETQLHRAVGLFTWWVAREYPAGFSSVLNKLQGTLAESGNQSYGVPYSFPFVRTLTQIKDSLQNEGSIEPATRLHMEDTVSQVSGSIVSDIFSTAFASTGVSNTSAFSAEDGETHVMYLNHQLKIVAEGVKLLANDALTELADEILLDLQNINNTSDLAEDYANADSRTYRRESISAKLEGASAIANELEKRGHENTGKLREQIKQVYSHLSTQDTEKSRSRARLRGDEFNLPK